MKNKLTKVKFLVFISYLLISFNIKAIEVIRDSEIENVINEVISPLKKVSGLKNLEIYIVNDQNTNAFTAGGDAIFINSGMIIKYPDPDVLRGVIAHEIGHILGSHISRRGEVIDNYMKASIGATILGVAAAASGYGSEGIAIAMGGMHISERSIFAYSRTFESSADQAAANLLEKSSHSIVGLIKFFSNTQKSLRGVDINPYEQTHPLSNIRLSALKNFLNKSKFKESQNSRDLVIRYQNAAAKLYAYTMPINQVHANRIGKDFYNKKDIANYIEAIKFFRKGRLSQAINYITKLVNSYPKNPYYHELKGQILFELGELSALDEYSEALKIRPKDLLIKLGRGIVYIEYYKEKKNNLYLEKGHKDLTAVLKKEPNNLSALYYMSTYYNAKNMKGKSYLNTAIISLLIGNDKNAKNMAKSAMKLLKKNTPDWYKASDIVNLTKNQRR